KGEKKSHLELVPTKTEDSDRSAWVPQLVLERVRAHRNRQEEERTLAGCATRRDCPRSAFTICATRPPPSLVWPAYLMRRSRSYWGTPPCARPKISTST